MEFSMNYKRCELHIKYKILSKYEQNTYFIKMLLIFGGVSWWSWVFAHLRGNIADDAVQMDFHKTLYPFYTTEKMPHVTVTITKNASLAAITRYISIMTVYTVSYLHIFSAKHFFSSEHCNDL